MQLMALIGEQFDETEDICGIVASVRQRGDKLALWTRTASNEAVQVGFGSHSTSVITSDTDTFLYTICSVFSSWQYCLNCCESLVAMLPSRIHVYISSSSCFLCWFSSSKSYFIIITVAW